MRSFILWWLINAASLFVVAAILPGVTMADGFLPLLGVALLVGVINATLRPILYIASCGLIVLTLGLIIPVLNALLLLLASEIAGDAFHVDGLLWALIAAMLMGFINSVLHGLIEDEEKEKPHARK